CGIKALTIHGRTRSQMYTGNADWSLIGKVKANPRIKIPIIGNGDITSSEEALTHFNLYQTDAIMIGRAAIGAPWIFRDIKGNINDPENYQPLTPSEKMEVLRRQLRESIERLDERRGILHIRRHLAATTLFKGIPNFRDTRIAMLRAEKSTDLMNIFDTIQEQFLS
ncbi:MAG: tRNA-dihydrouridine synthase, partial [Bacteroidales bacterium]